MAAGAYGNPNLMFIRPVQYTTFDGTSDQSAALAPDTQAITLFATQDCWVLVGTNPTAAPPGGENVKVDSVFIPAAAFMDMAVPAGTDAIPQLVAVIQDSTTGNLYIYERKPG